MFSAGDVNNLKIPHGGKTMSGIKTKNWLFMDGKCEKKHARSGPYITEWRSKYEPYGKRIRDLCTSSSQSGLPKIPNPKKPGPKIPTPKKAGSKSCSLPCSGFPRKTKPKQSSLTSRLTSRQLKRQESVNKVHTVLEKPKGMFYQLESLVGKDRHPNLISTLEELYKQRKCKDVNTDDYLKAHENLIDVLNTDTDTLELRRRTDWEERRTRKVSRLSEDSVTSEHNSEKPDVVDLESLLTKKNDYIYFSKKATEEREREERNQEKTEKAAAGARSDESNLKEAIWDFIDWMHVFGGHVPPFDENTLFCLFSAGYDTKSWTSPSVLKPNEIPERLRGMKVIPRLTVSKKFGKMRAESDHTGGQFDDVGFRYGAWYLDPKTWTKERKDAQMVDPRDLEIEAEMSEIDQKLQESAEELAELYITDGFRKFLEGRKERVPEYIKLAHRLRDEKEERESRRESDTTDDGRMASFVVSATSTGMASQTSSVKGAKFAAKL